MKRQRERSSAADRLGEESFLGQTLSRRQFLVAAGAGAASLALPALPSSASGSVARAAQLGDSVVVQWNEAFLQAVRNSRLGPPMVARALAIAHTCIYEAWAAFDHKALVGTAVCCAGIATTKGYKTYYNVQAPAPGVDANRTIYHVR
jgi:TAT (twin-arginine translocation) pathway signal sequence